MGLSQELRGKVEDAVTQHPITAVKISIGETVTYTDTNGYFRITNIDVIEGFLIVEARDYKTQRLPVKFTQENIDIGVIYLEKSPYQQEDNMVDISALSNHDDVFLERMPGVFHPLRDLFLRRAAYDFSQVFFKIRGYDTSRSVVMINGIPMNDQDTGVPLWYQWGGLNDLTYNQNYQFGLGYTMGHFGGLSGLINIEFQPEKFRPGLKLTYSHSNKAYSDRIMVTYSSATSPKGWNYATSASVRYAKEGYIQGTLYRAYSYFLGISKQQRQHKWGCIGFYTPVKRGLSAPITEEVFRLKGRRYNPYFGYQNGKIRNSGIRITHPVTLMSYYHFDTENWNVKAALSGQYFTSQRSRPDYNNAQNPDPVYYRKLPSYFSETSESEIVRQEFLENSQIDWNTLYLANTTGRNGESAYIIYADIQKNNRYSISLSSNFKPSNTLNVNGGTIISVQFQQNYAAILDFLGAETYRDVDIFSDTENDIGNTHKRFIKDKIKYFYTINSIKSNTYIQSQWMKRRWVLFGGLNYSNYRFQRYGRFRNELYKDSFGKGRYFNFSNWATKAGITYKIFGKHQLQLNAIYATSPPGYSKVYYNARRTNSTIPEVKSEKIFSGDLGYLFSGKRYRGKAVGFLSDFRDTTRVRYFYSNSGIGSDFFQEVSTGIGKRHLGVEFWSEYDISQDFSVNMVASVGQYRYITNPDVTVNFDPSDTGNTVSSVNSINLGKAFIKNYAVPSGPQQAYSLGFRYNSPKYWWVSPSFSFLTQNYISISNFIRTTHFFTNPNDPGGFPFSDISRNQVRKMFYQERIPGVLLINIAGGKSWRFGKTLFRSFLVVNNLLDKNYKTGGFEQTRAGHYGALKADFSKSTRTFGPKYWYGYGCTFYLNLSWSF